MYDNYNFPMGADTPDAPWNKKEVPEKNFTIDVTCVLEKKGVNVTTNDYQPEVVIRDEQVVEPLSTENTNWEQAYKECRYTIPELLQELENYIKQDLERYKGSSSKERQLKEMLEDCQGWNVYEETYEEQ